MLRKLTVIRMSGIAAAFIFLASCSEKETLSTGELLENASKSADNGAWKEAESFARRAVNSDKADPVAHTMSAIALEQCGNIKSAAAEAEKAVNLAPESFAAQYTLGRLLFEQQKYSECIEPLRKALKIKPQSLLPLTMLAEASQKLKSPDAAGYFAMLARAPSYRRDPAPWNELAVISAQKKGNKNLVEAARYFVQAYRLDPENPTIVYNLAVFLDSYYKDKKKALKYYRKYLQLTKLNPELKKNRDKVSKRISELSSGS